jgi:hypothetical protein
MFILLGKALADQLNAHPPTRGGILHLLLPADEPLLPAFKPLLPYMGQYVIPK